MTLKRCQWCGKRPVVLHIVRYQAVCGNPRCKVKPATPVEDTEDAMQWFWNKLNTKQTKPNENQETKESSTAFV